MFVEFLPAVAVGLFFGPFLDRLPRRGVMIVSDLVRCAVFCTLPFADSRRPDRRARRDRRVHDRRSSVRPCTPGCRTSSREDELARANSLIQTSENVSWTLAPVLGGAHRRRCGPGHAYWVNAVSFLLSALLIVRIRRDEAAGRARRRATATCATRRRVRPRRAHAPAAAPCSSSGRSRSSALAASNTAQVFLAKDTFSAGDFGYGLIFGCIGLGLAIGSFGAGTWVERRSVGSVYAASILLQAIGIGAAGVMPNVWAALPCFVLSGIGNGDAVVCNSLLVQRGAIGRGARPRVHGDHERQLRGRTG